VSIEFRATPVLLTAVAVFVAWRVIVWRRRGGDPLREAVIALLFGWALVVVRLTFFPMIIIFYDWYGSSNLIPFGSITQLITDTPASVAFENIAGNLLLFVPVGFLLPMLFVRLRSIPGLGWRAAVISATIEILQTFTRSRAFDVDDIILNTLGALAGYGGYVVFARLVRSSEAGRRLMARVESTGHREPLFAAFVPVGVTLLLVVPMMASSIASATLGAGSGGLTRDATSLWPGGAVVGTVDVDRYRFVTVTDGPAPSVVGLVEYQRVLPGRFTRNSWGDIPAGGNVYNTHITAFNITRDELPVVATFGSTDGSATTVQVSAPGLSEVFDLGAGPFFVLAFPYDIQANTGPDELVSFDFVFRDAAGNDVSSAYSPAFE